MGRNLLEVTSPSNEELPHQSSKASADHGPSPLAISFGADAKQWVLLSHDADMAHFKSVCFPGGPSNPCDARVAAFDWMAFCSLA